MPDITVFEHCGVTNQVLHTLPTRTSKWNGVFVREWIMLTLRLKMMRMLVTMTVQMKKLVRGRVEDSDE
jgi:hypothetical protein